MTDHVHVPDDDFAAFMEEAKVSRLFPERDDCEHDEALDRSHSCPGCGGVLRRCCLSIVGKHEHRDGCPEVARRSRDVA